MFIIEQSQLLIAIKTPIIGLIKRQITQELERDLPILIQVVGQPSLNINIKQTAGHWTLFGSVQISLENFPVVYDGEAYQVDFTFLLLENGDEVENIASNDMIFFYGS